MNELQVRQALQSQGEILSLKYSGIGLITISLVSTKHWVAEIGLSSHKLEQKCKSVKGCFLSILLKFFLVRKQSPLGIFFKIPAFHAQRDLQMLGLSVLLPGNNNSWS